MTDTPTQVSPDPSPTPPSWYAKKYALPLWALILAGFLAIGIGASSSGGTEEKPKADPEELGSARERIDKLEVDLAKAESEAKDAKKAVEAELSDRKAEVDAAAAQLAKDKADFEAAKTLQEKSQFTDGTYEVGTEVMPGKYHRDDNGQSCYWAKMGNGDEIIDNDNVSGPVTLIIEPSVEFFESSRCGEWKKVG